MLKLRRAGSADLERLRILRRRSILQLGPAGMTDEQARTWANVMTPSRMKQKLSELEIWFAEEDGGLVGWAGVAGDRVDGMYVDPAFARRGVGARMLEFAERQIAARGFEVARLEASWNAEEWYVRRGYKPTAPRPANGPRPMVKKLGA